MNTILDAQISYATGGAVWTFQTPFSTIPAICIGIQLKLLEDNIYPLSHKITALTTTSVTVKVYKVVLENSRDLLFSECAENEVVVHMTAEGE